MCHIFCDSLESFQAGFGPHAKEIMADIPNYKATLSCHRATRKRSFNACSLLLFCKPRYALASASSGDEKYGNDLD